MRCGIQAGAVLSCLCHKHLEGKQAHYGGSSWEQVPGLVRRCGSHFSYFVLGLSLPCNVAALTSGIAFLHWQVETRATGREEGHVGPSEHLGTQVSFMARVAFVCRGIQAFKHLACRIVWLWG